MILRAAARELLRTSPEFQEALAGMARLTATEPAPAPSAGRSPTID